MKLEATCSYGLTRKMIKVYKNSILEDIRKII